MKRNLADFILQKAWSGPVSRILCLSRAEDHSSAERVTAPVEQPTRTLERERAVPSRPYLVLLRRGFAVPPPLARGAVRSYRTISPLPPSGPFARSRTIGGLLSVALSVASRRLAVSQPAARRSSDFPPRSCDRSDPPVRSTHGTITRRQQRTSRKSIQLNSAVLAS